MTESAPRSVVPVEQLREGMYVDALDRPWVETPFALQGFRVGPDEIALLRIYCRYVYVDRDRSEAGVALELASEDRTEVAEQWSSRTARALARRPLPAEVRACVGALFEPVARPDRDRFDRLVATARERADAAYTAVRDVLGRVHADRPVHLARATRAVDGVTRLIEEDPSALLWLARMHRHDDYLALHSTNACALALAFGAYLGIDGERLQHLGLGVLLMDVGMAAIPPSVLRKPRALSRTEEAVVRRHVDHGYRRLAASGLPQVALEIVRQHHERQDGGGYPHGIGGDQIPRQALIAGLADTYDAMTTTRPYRSARRPEQALQDMYTRADHTFGRELVEAFIRCMGTYPAGSVVELDNFAVGIVVGSQPGHGLWPTVLLLRGPSGRPFEKGVLLNLAAAAGDPEMPARYIRRGLNESDMDINVGNVVAGEFGQAA